jgi:hypothetical protein
LKETSLDIGSLKNGRELLLVSAPVKDDSDYEHLYLAACDVALKDLKEWFESNDIKVEYFINWGSPWDSEFEDSIDFYLNYVAKIVSNDISEEAQMIYKLKYDDVYPVKNLKSYMENLFK